MGEATLFTPPSDILRDLLSASVLAVISVEFECKSPLLREWRGCLDEVE